MARRDGSHSRNRSLSDFVPEATHVVRPRNATLPSQPGAPDLHREEYIAEQRGFVHQTHEQGNSQSAFPTPPSSNRSVTESEGDDSRSDIFREFFVVPDARGGTISYRPVRLLGQGTFSKVVLATSEPFESKRALRETPEADFDAKRLVAIKIVEHGPAAGANAERMQLSLKREIELMQEISHPSLIHLESFDTSGDAALLVLNYCAGGDLFDLACQHRDVLSQAMVQRIFAELVGAVLYLHEKWIVHRDIKLESKPSSHCKDPLTAADVLVNFPVQTLSTIDDPTTYPHSLVTLTDLGLSRELPRPPAAPTLTTRCGSEDYAAPEIMLSQPYDGRADGRVGAGRAAVLARRGPAALRPAAVQAGEQGLAARQDEGRIPDREVRLDLGALRGRERRVGRGAGEGVGGREGRGGGAAEEGREGAVGAGEGEGGWVGGGRHSGPGGHSAAQ